MKVMFYVQHLLGIGHLVRTSRIAAAFSAAGHPTTVVSGGSQVDGFPPSGVSILQLPPVRTADQSFSALVRDDGVAVDAHFKQQRAARLIEAYDTLRPDIVLIEAFPFARRQMRFELLPLLDHVHEDGRARRALVVSSVRDILQPKGHERDLKTSEVVKRYFDLVLVHGERGSGFEQTFSQANQLADRIAYTGLVGPAQQDLVDGDGDAFDVIVSAGGGVVGARLLETALAARPLTRFASGSWLVVCGPNLDQETFNRLEMEAGGGITLRRFDPRLAARFAKATVAVSQAGYNTVSDVMSAGCASVLVPFEGEAEHEQLMRATALAQAGRSAVVRERDLSAERLAAAIDQAADAFTSVSPVKLDGAAESVRLVADRLAVFRRGQSA